MQNLCVPNVLSLPLSNFPTDGILLVLKVKVQIVPAYFVDTLVSGKAEKY